MHLYSPQAVSSCTPNGTKCCSSIDENSLGCRVSCTGLYADAFYIKDPTEEKLMKELKENMEEYTGYKNNFARNLEFDPTKKDLSIFRTTQNQTLRIPVVLRAPPCSSVRLIHFFSRGQRPMERWPKATGPPQELEVRGAERS